VSPVEYTLKKVKNILSPNTPHSITSHTTFNHLTHHILSSITPQHISTTPNFVLSAAKKLCVCFGFPEAQKEDDNLQAVVL